jgi:hypothetical protein
MTSCGSANVLFTCGPLRTILPTGSYREWHAPPCCSRSGRSVPRRRMTAKGMALRFDHGPANGRFCLGFSDACPSPARGDARRQASEEPRARKPRGVGTDAGVDLWRIGRRWVIQVVGSGEGEMEIGVSASACCTRSPTTPRRDPSSQPSRNWHRPQRSRSTAGGEARSRGCCRRGCCPPPIPASNPPSNPSPERP